MRFKSRSRALIGAAAAASLALAGLTTVAPSVSAAPADTVRVDGGDTFTGGTRYDTAADAATRAYPDGADTVIIATGQKFPDALAANGIAGANDAPILIVQQDAIPAATDAALTTLDPTNLVLVGGEAAISADVEAEFTNDGFNVTREFGENRFETAEVVAETIGTAPAIDAGQGDGALSSVVLANGLVNNGVDSIAVSPALHNQDIPLLLTGADSLQANAASAIDTLAPDQVIIVGGTGVVSQDIEDGLEADGKNVVRLSGDTRFTTATAIADFEINQLGMAATNTHLAFGFKFPDALVGGPLASQQNGPILLTSSLPQDTEDWIVANAEAITTIYALGGTAVIDDATLQAAADAADPGTNQSFTVTPSETATNEIVLPGDEPDTSDDRQYSVSGLDDSATYDIFLFPAENVTDDGGTISFDDTNDDDVAEWAATEGFIAAVNGSSNADTNGTVLDVGPVSGTIEFTIDGDDVDEVIPVLVAHDTDATDTAPDVDLDANNEPTEDFGIGGQKNWLTPEAASGEAAYNTVETETINFDSSSFVGDTDGTAEGNPSAADGDLTFFWDSNDEFQLNGTPITMAEFEGMLTAADNAVDDELDIVYTQNESLSSTFNVTDEDIDAPTDVEAAVSNEDGDAEANDVTISWTASVQGDAVYDVFRDVDDDGVYEPGTDDSAGQIADNTTDTSVLASDQPDGTYVYFVDAVAGTSGDTNDTASNEVTVPPVADTAGPLAVDTLQTTTSGLSGTFDSGDVFKVVYDEVVAAPAVGDIIRAEDNDGTPTVADFENGANSTWTLNASAETVNEVSRPAGTVITVELTAEPTVVTAGTTAGLQSPATIVDQSGTSDDDGNAWDLTAGTQDLNIDKDANDTTADSTDSSGPQSQSATINDAGTAGTVDSGDTLTVVFNEAMEAPASGDAFTLTETTGDGDGGDVVCGTNATCSRSTTNTANDTLVFEITGALTNLTEGGGTDDANSTVETPAAASAPNSVLDASGNNWDIAGSSDVTFG